MLNSLGELEWLSWREFALEKELHWRGFVIENVGIGDGQESVEACMVHALSASCTPGAFLLGNCGLPCFLACLHWSCCFGQRGYAI